MEHVGSTAVEGMLARPVIDVLLGVTDQEAVDAGVQVLREHGYVVEGSTWEHTWLCRPAPGQRASTVDVVIQGSAKWAERLRFRDLLRADADLARRFADLKTELAGKQMVLGDYLDARQSFVEATLAAPR